MTGAFGPPSLVAGQARVVPIPSSNCGVPAAAAYSLNFVSITPVGQPVAWVAAWQDDMAFPGTVVLNALQGGVVDNSAIVAAGADGGIQVICTNNGDLVIDMNGYYVQAATIQGPARSIVQLGTAEQRAHQARRAHLVLAGHAGAIGPAGAAGSVGAAGPPSPWIYRRDGRSRAGWTTGRIGATGVTGAVGLVEQLEQPEPPDPSDPSDQPA